MTVQNQGDADDVAPENRLDTRTKLILTAERLLAEGGISSTPLRRITQEANQRNESAIHYHFGSRQGVVEAKPYLPVQVVCQTFGLAIQMSTYSLARMEKFAGELGDTFDWLKAEAQVAGIADTIAAIFDAPVSPQAVHALRASKAPPKA